MCVARNERKEQFKWCKNWKWINYGRNNKKDSELKDSELKVIDNANKIKFVN